MSRSGIVKYFQPLQLVPASRPLASTQSGRDIRLRAERLLRSASDSEKLNRLDRWLVKNNSRRMAMQQPRRLASNASLAQRASILAAVNPLRRTSSNFKLNHSTALMRRAPALQKHVSSQAIVSYNPRTLATL